MKIKKYFFDVTYTFHVEIEDETLQIIDVTVKGASIIRVMNPEIISQAQSEFMYHNLMAGR